MQRKASVFRDRYADECLRNIPGIDTVVPVEGSFDDFPGFLAKCRAVVKEQNASRGKRHVTPIFVMPFFPYGETDIDVAAILPRILRSANVAEIYTDFEKCRFHCFEPPVRIIRSSGQVDKTTAIVKAWKMLASRLATTGIVGSSSDMNASLISMREIGRKADAMAKTGFGTVISNVKHFVDTTASYNFAPGVDTSVTQHVTRGMRFRLLHEVTVQDDADKLFRPIQLQEALATTQVDVDLDVLDRTKYRQLFEQQRFVLHEQAVEPRFFSIDARDMEFMNSRFNGEVVNQHMFSSKVSIPLSTFVDSVRTMIDEKENVFFPVVDSGMMNVAVCGSPVYHSFTRETTTTSENSVFVNDSKLNDDIFFKSVTKEGATLDDPLAPPSPVLDIVPPKNKCIIVPRKLDPRIAPRRQLLLWDVRQERGVMNDVLQVLTTEKGDETPIDVDPATTFNIEAFARVDTEYAPVWLQQMQTVFWRFKLLDCSANVFSTRRMQTMSTGHYFIDDKAYAYCLSQPSGHMHVVVVQQDNTVNQLLDITESSQLLMALRYASVDVELAKRLTFIVDPCIHFAGLDASGVAGDAVLYNQRLRRAQVIRAMCDDIATDYSNVVEGRIAEFAPMSLLNDAKFLGYVNHWHTPTSYVMPELDATSEPRVGEKLDCFTNFPIAESLARGDVVGMPFAFSCVQEPGKPPDTRITAFLLGHQSTLTAVDPFIPIANESDKTSEDGHQKSLAQRHVSPVPLKHMNIRDVAFNGLLPLFPLDIDAFTKFIPLPLLEKAAFAAVFHITELAMSCNEKLKMDKKVLNEHCNGLYDLCVALLRRNKFQHPVYFVLMNAVNIATMETYEIWYSKAIITAIHGACISPEKLVAPINSRRFPLEKSPGALVRETPEFGYNRLLLKTLREKAMATFEGAKLNKKLNQINGKVRTSTARKMYIREEWKRETVNNTTISPFYRAVLNDIYLQQWRMSTDDIVSSFAQHVLFHCKDALDEMIAAVVSKHGMYFTETDGAFDMFLSRLFDTDTGFFSLSPSEIKTFTEKNGVECADVYEACLYCQFMVQTDQERLVAACRRAFAIGVEAWEKVVFTRNTVELVRASFALRGNFTEEREVLKTPSITIVQVGATKFQLYSKLQWLFCSSLFTQIAKRLLRPDTFFIAACRMHGAIPMGIFWAFASSKMEPLMRFADKFTDTLLRTVYPHLKTNAAPPDEDTPEAKQDKAYQQTLFVYNILFGAMDKHMKRLTSRGQLLRLNDLRNSDLGDTWRTVIDQWKHERDDFVNALWLPVPSDSGALTAAVGGGENEDEPTDGEENAATVAATTAPSEKKKEDEPTDEEEAVVATIASSVDPVTDSDEDLPELVAIFQKNHPMEDMPETTIQVDTEGGKEEEKKTNDGEGPLPEIQVDTEEAKLDAVAAPQSLQMEEMEMRINDIHIPLDGDEPRKVQIDQPGVQSVVLRLIILM